MAAPLASATLLDGRIRQDISVPSGTTVAGLLSILQIETAGGSVRVTRVDGSPVDLEKAIGTDLPSGVLLALSGGKASREARTRAATTTTSPWVRLAVASLVAVILVIGLLGVGVVAPLLGLWFLPFPVRLGAAALVIAVCVWALTRHAVHTNAVGTLACTGALGVAATVCIPLQWELGPDLIALSGTWGAVVASMVLQLSRPSPLHTAALTVWTVVAVVLTGAVLMDADLRMLAAVALSLACLFLGALPNLALKIPDSQLLDLPLVTTSAQTVRTPPVKAPARITVARIRRSLTEAVKRSDILLVFLCVLSVVAATATTTFISFSTWEGIAALAFHLCAALTLALVPRTRRDFRGRILPRVSSLIIMTLTITCHGVSSVVGLLGVVALLLTLAMLLALSNAAIGSSDPSPFLARVGDITQSLASFFVLPLAVYGAGIFTLVREVSS